MSLPPSEDPSQDPEDREMIEGAAPLKRPRTSLSMSPVPGNAAMPQLLGGMRLLGLIDCHINLVGLNLRNMNGGPRTNVMAAARMCVGSTLYRGPYQSALAQTNNHNGPYYMINLCCNSLFISPGARCWRTVEMTLRFVGTLNEDAKPVPKVAGSEGEFLVILIPRGVLLLPNRDSDLPYTSPRIRLVLEDMLEGQYLNEASKICQFYFK
ncbi:uncharacterized protein FMAN_11104 [Fusarium mangiferae]|uniref:Uncharacterized protein n=1 Tax=Fusarium mangiferae TaxID=192010 RepID=A0A1L7TM85_FUSMA|nr:uncharacterized protein FMAN_11104 [Fusarium mangiferae]CVK96775.1 uncharacterized protein FMAN_11104 [Fusarium mangiferae]